MRGNRRLPTDTGDPLRSPVIEYSHGSGDLQGSAVIGGYVYQGTDLTVLTDRYVFADWRANQRLFVATELDSGDWRTDVVPIDGSLGKRVLAFGTDPDGELYVCTTDRDRVEGSTGAVYRLVSADDE